MEQNIYNHILVRNGQTRIFQFLSYDLYLLQRYNKNFFILLLGAKNKIKISLFYFSCNFNPNFSNRFFNCCLLASCCKRSLISACSCFILVPKSICSSRLPQTALAIVEGPAQLLTRRRPYPSQRGSLPARRALPHSQQRAAHLNSSPLGFLSPLRSESATLRDVERPLS